MIVMGASGDPLEVPEAAEEGSDLGSRVDSPSLSVGRVGSGVGVRLVLVGPGVGLGVGVVVRGDANAGVSNMVGFGIGATVG
jgi:hypothetical protein